jgi:hypothetical protein
MGLGIPIVLLAIFLRSSDVKYLKGYFKYPRPTAEANNGFPPGTPKFESVVILVVLNILS